MSVAVMMKETCLPLGTVRCMVASAWAGAALMAPHLGPDEALRLADLVRASTEVMRPGSGHQAARPDDTLARALRLMIEDDMDVLPVVNDCGQGGGKNIRAAHLPQHPLACGRGRGDWQAHVV